MFSKVARLDLDFCDEPVYVRLLMARDIAFAEQLLSEDPSKRPPDWTIQLLQRSLCDPEGKLLYDAGDDLQYWPAGVVIRLAAEVLEANFSVASKYSSNGVALGAVQRG